MVKLKQYDSIVLNTDLEIKEETIIKLKKGQHGCILEEPIGDLILVEMFNENNETIYWGVIKQEFLNKEDI